jgi:hypothetical protein
VHQISKVLGFSREDLSAEGGDADMRLARLIQEGDKNANKDTEFDRGTIWRPEYISAPLVMRRNMTNLFHKCLQRLQAKDLYEKRYKEDNSNSHSFASLNTGEDEDQSMLAMLNALMSQSAGDMTEALAGFQKQQEADMKKRTAHEETLRTLTLRISVWNYIAR